MRRGRSATNKIKSVMDNGKIVATMQATDKPEFSGRIYYNVESRGYQTDFEGKGFYYIITFKNGIPTHIEGVSRDSRRKNFLAHCKAQNIDLTIVSPAYFDKWIS